MLRWPSCLRTPRVYKCCATAATAPSQDDRPAHARILSAADRPLEAEEPPILGAATLPPFENGAATSPPSEIGAGTPHPVLGAAATTTPTHHSADKLLPLSCVRSLHVHRPLSPSTSASPSPLVRSLPLPAAPHAASHHAPWFIIVPKILCSPLHISLSITIPSKSIAPYLLAVLPPCYFT
jgi:hypothetical protein